MQHNFIQHFQGHNMYVPTLVTHAVMQSRHPMHGSLDVKNHVEQPGNPIYLKTH